MASSAEQHILASLKGSLESGRYSDLKITCGSDDYNVHKVIVCEQANFFADAVEISGQESAEGKIDLPKEEAANIKLLIQYLYEGDYEPQLPDKRCGLLADTGRPKLSPAGNIYSYDFPHTCGKSNKTHEVCPHHICSYPEYTCGFKCKNFICNTCYVCYVPLTGDSSQLLLHIEMCGIAKKYQAAGLENLATEKFYRACHHFWKEADFAIAARQACATTSGYYNSLLESVAKVIFEHLDALIKKPEIEALLAESSRLAYRVLKFKIEADGQE